jgi:hypothetical protein
VYVSEFLAYTTSVDESFKEFKVKRIISAILISAALAFGFASCDDGAAGGGAGFNAVGTWELVFVSNISGPYDARYIFKSDWYWESIVGSKLIYSGTWRYTDTGIELTTGYGSGPSYRRYDSATRDLVHESPAGIYRYAKQ